MRSTTNRLLTRAGFRLFLAVLLALTLAPPASAEKVPVGALRPAQVIQVLMGEQFRKMKKPYKEALKSGIRETDITDGRFVFVRTRPDRYGSKMEIYLAYTPPELALELGDFVEVRRGGRVKGKPVADQITRLERRAERVPPPSDDRDWTIGNRDSGLGITMTEYVPSGQSIDHWQELLTTQSFYGLQDELTVDEVAEDLQKNIKKRCPTAHLSFIRREPGNILYEWSFTGCRGYEDQHDIGRLIGGATAIHHIFHSQKTSALPPEEREKWLGLLGAVVLEEGVPL